MRALFSKLPCWDNAIQVYKWQIDIYNSSEVLKAAANSLPANPNTYFVQFFTIFAFLKTKREQAVLYHKMPGSQKFRLNTLL